MGKRRNRTHAPRPAPAVQTAPAASWGWRSGVSSGGYDGAKFRGALRAMYPSGADLDAEALRARSRLAWRESSQARALLARLVDSVVGTGLTLRSAPAWNLIKSTMSEEERRALSDEIDERFRLWADSHEPDAAGRRTLAELQGFAFAEELRAGDLPIVLRYSGDSSRVSPLSLQFLDADQLDVRQTTLTSPPAGLALEAQGRGNLLKDGLELTPAGELVAIYVLDPLKPYGAPTRVPVKGKAGRRFVLLPAILDQPGQARGVGPLALLTHDLEKLTDYEVAEIEAAVSNALIAGLIKPSESSDTRTNLGKALGGGIQTRGAATSSGTTEATTTIDKPGIWVGAMKAGEDLVSFDTKRPNVNFGAFVDTVTKSLSASLSIPVEVLNLSFNANYSASRAALILFWSVVERWRVHVVSQILAPVYEAWLSEEVASGRLPALVGNGFATDPVRRRAWLQADWVGDSMPSIDPVKDAQAVDLRIAQGATTREREALRHNRSDFYDNAARLAREEAVLPKAPAPAAAAPAEDDEEDENEPDKKAKGFLRRIFRPKEGTK